MAGYEHFWDAVSTERTLVVAMERANKNLQNALDKVDEVQKKLHEAQTEAKRAKAECEKAKALDMARKMIADGMNVETAAKYTDLTETEIKSLLR